MNLFYQPLVPEGVSYLDEEESRHCVKVLRRRNGDTIRITDGAGHFYSAIISSASPSRCEFSITEITTDQPPPYYIHIALSPTKNADRVEWFVEKATELGVHKITLLETEHTERTFIKKDRLDKVAVSAMKQSLKAYVPVIEPLTRIEDLVKNAVARGEIEKLIAYVDTENPNHLMDAVTRDSSYLVLIGPEGDFSPRELELCISAGFKKVSLGKSRLRTETAGVAACHILNVVNR